jgi:hypothetical protein
MLAIARDVRSSKGEIVLGLTIGLGVSLLLAGLGQAYLRGDSVASDPGAPAPVESVTMSARPESPGPSSGGPLATPGAGGMVIGNVAPSAVPLAAAPTAAQRGSVRVDGSGARRVRTSRRSGAGAATDSSDAAASASGSVLLAQAAASKRTEPAAERMAAARPARAASAPEALVDDALGVSRDAPPSAVPSEPAPPSSAPLTPAESAGLGLDLPL